MKLAAIYNAWADGADLLKKSIDNISPVVDGIFVVYSELSNYGTRREWNVEEHLNEKCFKVLYSPGVRPVGAAANHECAKRNAGLDAARNFGFTHFLMLDCDEFYQPDEVEIYKEWIDKNNIAGTVCGLKTYFKLPTLTIGMDHTLVPFIHRITPTLKFEMDSKTYPFAYDAAGAHIDPTRRLNITSGVEKIDIVMHHYSWVRSDFVLKIENSSARNNLRRSSILADLDRAAPGAWNEFYRTHLSECPNYFDI